MYTVWRICGSYHLYNHTLKNHILPCQKSTSQKGLRYVEMLSVSNGTVPAAALATDVTYSYFKRVLWAEMKRLLPSVFPAGTWRQYDGD